MESPRLSNRFVVEFVAYFEPEYTKYMLDFHATSYSMKTAEGSRLGDMFNVMWCTWPNIRGRKTSVPAVAYAYSRQTVRISCAVPMDAACVDCHQQANDANLKIELQLWLQTGPGESYSLRISLTSRKPASKKARRASLVLCSKPWYDVGGLVVEYPDAVRSWLSYYRDVIGVSEFWLYDTDGSLAQHMPSEFTPHVRYFSEWPNSFPTLGKLTRDGWHYSSEVLAYDHCLYSNLGSADWIMYVHGLDAYYYSPRADSGGGRTLMETLEDQQREQPRELPLCGVSVRRCEFGGERGTGGLAEAFLYRMENCSKHEPFGMDDPILPADGSALYFSGHRPVCRHLESRTAIMELGEWRVNHYQDAFAIRCGTSCNTLDRGLQRLLRSSSGLD